MLERMRVKVTFKNLQHGGEHKETFWRFEYAVAQAALTNCEIVDYRFYDAD